ncbi:hypothetical protein ES703_44084 [subsurface metagenome]
MQQMLFKGIKASDLLEDIFLRFNPYAEDKKQIEKLKKERLRKLEEVVEKGAETSDLIEWGKETVSLFKAVNLRTYCSAKPRAISSCSLHRGNLCEAARPMY